MPSETEKVNYRLIWNTRKELVLAILSFTFAFVIFTMLVLQQINPIKNAFAELKTSNQELIKFKTKVQELENLSLDNSYNRKTEVDGVLPSYKPLLELLNNLNSVAVKSETLIENLALSPGEIATDSTLLSNKRKKLYDELVLEFSVSGNLINVQNFMTLIEQVTPISTITNISLNQQTLEDNSVETVASLTLKTFYFTQAIATTITEPLPSIDDEYLIILGEITKLVPNDLPTQQDVIKNDRGNLFDLQGLSLEEFESQLRVNQEQVMENTEQNLGENEPIIDNNNDEENALNQENDSQQEIPTEE